MNQPVVVLGDLRLREDDDGVHNLSKILHGGNDLGCINDRPRTPLSNTKYELKKIEKADRK